MPTKTTDPGYRQHLDTTNARQRAQSLAGRDISAGYPDPPGSFERRDSCQFDLQRFFETYFPATFSLPTCPDQTRGTLTMQKAILDRGLFALAWPRGAGKTSRAIRAAIWALLYRHRRYVVLIGSTDAKAGQLLKQIKRSLLTNDLLLEDFRSVCYPIRRMDDNGRLCQGQLFQGEHTSIEWSDSSLVLPTMPDEACDGANVSGSTFIAGGLTGALRGPTHMLPTGEVIRPDLVIADDPQTRESARSATQTQQRLEILLGDILGFAGPDQEITTIVPCTVIEPGDLADQLTDRKRFPQFQGERTKAVYSWPAATKLWDTYLDMRAEGMRHGTGATLSHQFYAEHQAEMDEGGKVAWEARKPRDKLSAIQHMVDLRADIGDDAFASEYQNDPLISALEASELTADEICNKLSKVDRGIVPVSCQYLTCFIDVQQTVLFYVVAAWEKAFTGYVVDYGTWPDQGRHYFTLNDSLHTIQAETGIASIEGSIHEALTVLVGKLLEHDWDRQGGTVAKIDRLLVDAGWVTDLVYQFCRETKRAPVVMPSHGKFIGASSKPMHEWEKDPKSGEWTGVNWRSPVPTRRAIRHILFDSNWWKSFIHARLRGAIGERGSLSLFGDRPGAHRMIADHLKAEQRIKVTGRGRECDEWKNAGKLDNHWFDGLVGSAVAAATVGAVLQEVGGSKAKRAATGKSFQQMQDEALKGR